MPFAGRSRKSIAGKARSYAPEEVPLGDAPEEVPLGGAPKEVPLGDRGMA